MNAKYLYHKLLHQNKCGLTLCLYNHAPIIWVKNCKYGDRSMGDNYLNLPFGFSVPQKL